MSIYPIRRAESIGLMEQRSDSSTKDYRILKIKKSSWRKIKNMLVEAKRARSQSSGEFLFPVRLTFSPAKRLTVRKLFVDSRRKNHCILRNTAFFMRNSIHVTVV